jgi:ATP/maltotriose-dependent transcriptional regulator MalT
MPDGEAAYPFYGSRAATSLHDVQRDLAQSWRAMLASQTDQALTFVEAIERQLDNLSPLAATRCRAASRLIRSAVLASQNHSLAVLAIVISEVLAEGRTGQSTVLKKTRSQPERFAVGSLGSGSELSAPGSDAITVRERDVLSMISQGCSNKRIARMLNISPETVKSHVKRIFSKLSVSTRTEAVSRAVSRGLVDVPIGYAR